VARYLLPMTRDDTQARTLHLPMPTMMPMPARSWKMSLG